MKRIHFLSLILLLLVLAGINAAQAPQPATLVAGSATLDEVKGQVTVTPPGGGAATPAQRGQAIAPETTVEVGSKGSALLHLEDGSQVLIKDNTRVVLKVPETSGNFLQVLLGKIVAKVQKRMNNAPSFRMGTPTAVITVRGTRFEVDVDRKGKTFVEVFEGVVEVGSMSAPNSPVLLRPGFHTNVDTTGAPESPQQRAYLRHPGGSGDATSWGGASYGNDDRTSTTGGEREGQAGQSSQPQEQETEPPH
jgi:hypothetical protein